MKYVGPLYGKIGRKCFDTGKTSEDWDSLDDKIKELRCILREVCHTSDVQNQLTDTLNDRIDAELGQLT
jgi:hypothetical protein